MKCQNKIVKEGSGSILVSRDNLCYKTLSTPLVGRIEFKAWALPAKDSNTNFSIRLGSSLTSRESIVVSTNQTNRWFYSRKGSGRPVAKNYRLDWTEVKIVINSQKSTYSLWIDNQLIEQNIPADRSIQNGIDSIGLHSGRGKSAHASYIDDIHISEMDQLRGAGVVTIIPEPDSLNAPWTLKGKDYRKNSRGMKILSNLAPGRYEIYWQNIEGWNPPGVGPQVVEVYEGRSVYIRGAYETKSKVEPLVFSDLNAIDLTGLTHGQGGGCGDVSYVGFRFFDDTKKYFFGSRNGAGKNRCRFADGSEGREGKIVLDVLAPWGCNVLAGDYITIRYDNNKKLNIYLPSINAKHNPPLNLYVSRDGSTYYDPGLTRLARRAR